MNAKEARKRPDATSEEVGFERAQERIENAVANGEYATVIPICSAKVVSQLRELGFRVTSDRDGVIVSW